MNTHLTSKVSIALCTYNGERFLQEQLESIAAQIVPPFELVVCDDASSDSTQKILNSFAETADFPVRLHFNTENLGYVKNFEEAISFCEGDIIALCDQDDKWRADKIEVLQKYFCDPRVGMAFSNAAIIDESGKLTGQKLWDATHFDRRSREQFSRGNAYQELYLKNIVSGCTMAFRSKWWPLISPLPEDIPFIHDAWIAFMISLYSEVILINQPLIQHRVHSQQSTASGRNKTVVSAKVASIRDGDRRQHYQMHLNQLSVIRERVFATQADIPLEKQEILLQWVKAHEQHLMVRLGNGNKWQTYKGVFKELISGRYHHFSNGFKSVIADLLCRISR